MLSQLIGPIAALSILAFSNVSPAWSPSEKVLSTHEMSLDDRYPIESVNQVFKDNILLNLAYLDGRVKSAKDINWNYLENPYTFEFKLNPGESFAFHDDVLPEYNGKITKTTNAHFNSVEGFKSDGYLVGDGVCHLASLINWSAKDAGLNVLAPTNHNFANIPEVPKEDGAAIYYYPGKSLSNEKQNLYITNNFDKPVIFRFQYLDDKLTASVIEDI